MSRWLLQLAFGLALGVAARAVLPGHHSSGFLLAGLLSLAGAAGGGTVAELVFPAAVLRKGGYMLSGLGAIAMLLIHAMWNAL